MPNPKIRVAHVRRLLGQVMVKIGVTVILAHEVEHFMTFCHAKVEASQQWFDLARLGGEKPSGVVEVEALESVLLDARHLSPSKGT